MIYLFYIGVVWFMFLFEAFNKGKQVTYEELVPFLIKREDFNNHPHVNNLKHIRCFFNSPLREEFQRYKEATALKQTKSSCNCKCPLRLKNATNIEISEED